MLPHMRAASRAGADSTATEQAYKSSSNSIIRTGRRRAERAAQINRAIRDIRAEPYPKDLFQFNEEWADTPRGGRGWLPFALMLAAATRFSFSGRATRSILRTSRDCQHFLRTDPSLGQLDSCAAFRDAALAPFVEGRPEPANANQRWPAAPVDDGTGTAATASGLPSGCWLSEKWCRSKVTILSCLMLRTSSNNPRASPHPTPCGPRG